MFRKKSIQYFIYRLIPVFWINIKHEQLYSWKKRVSTSVAEPTPRCIHVPEETISISLPCFTVPNYRKLPNAQTSPALYGPKFALSSTFQI